jgi:hypothetical protein
VATITVTNSSRKASTHRWTIQNRQVSTTVNRAALPKKNAGR